MQSNNVNRQRVTDVEGNGDEIKTKDSHNSGDNKVARCLRNNSLTLLTVVGVFGGAGLGFILRSINDGQQWSEQEIMYVNFVGDIFLRMLKSLILPLIVSSLISAIANLDLSLSGKIATKAILYYVVTTVLAISLGILLVLTIRPGESSAEEHVTREETARNVTAVDTLLDMVRNMFPPNLIEACIRQYKTVLTPSTSGNDKLTQKSVDGTNILGLVVFSVIFGVTLARLGDEGKLLAKFFTALMTAMMRITSLVIWFSPVGIFFLVAAKILEVEDFNRMIGQMGLYFVTVLGGVLIHGFITLPLLYVIITRKSPITYTMNISQALVTAFGTASSSATLPVAIQCLEEKNKIDPRVTRFLLPIGTTINMDGTALYEAVAAIFIAQMRGIILSFGNIVAVSITATAASIGAAGIPQAGLVTMVMVLDTVGLPASDVSLILAVDWLLDRFRTTVNVAGDAYGAGIIDHLCRDDLNSLSTKDAPSENQITNEN